jgi:hypothetical protein
MMKIWKSTLNRNKIFFGKIFHISNLCLIYFYDFQRVFTDFLVVFIEAFFCNEKPVNLIAEIFNFQKKKEKE